MILSLVIYVFCIWLLVNKTKNTFISDILISLNVCYDPKVPHLFAYFLFVCLKTIASFTAILSCIIDAIRNQPAYLRPKFLFMMFV